MSEGPGEAKAWRGGKGRTEGTGGGGRGGAEPLSGERSDVLARGAEGAACEQRRGGMSTCLSRGREDASREATDLVKTPGYEVNVSHVVAR